ncbi:transcriptional regulator [Secundilactobacillus odoratitofui DSM 19909 = JCM 15043]|uniref:Transcriptional regulator n=1 Tax=Secundilactobacillus odoratitofui DSM 19909 = JCM 15043 TaxID=1423776 RepID=A0A0R1LRR7_9LACO|nr:GntR family transcriptional regulator [Secundilactobacillus odoratitofui]KRK98517.1 transcriptional regulator [Secundilactobacillus odoratitofui DSM 19909 = JCM 15043]
MEFNDKVPIYYQIKTVIYDQIIAGERQPGEKLPAVRQLAVSLTVNVNTVQRALSEMIAEGAIVSKRGKGNFVTEDTQVIETIKTQLITEHLSNLYEQLHRLNIDDQDIINALVTYIERRGNSDDNH